MEVLLTKSIEQNYSQTEPNCEHIHKGAFASKDASELQNNQQDLNLHRRRFEELAKRLNINPLQAYQIPRTNRFYKHLPFIRKHYGNLQNATKAFYPEYTRSESPLDKTHSRYVQVHHKTKLEEIAKEFNIKCLDDWYNVSRTQLYDKAPFIPGTYGSLQNALEAFYPNHSWDVSRFGVKTKNYWNDKVNQKNALERVASELNIKTVEDWYKTSRKRLYIKLPFIQKYYGTLFVALSSLYPKHDWNALKFERAPLGLWNSPNAKVEFKEVIEQLIHKYNIKEYEDWKSIPWNDYRLFQRIAKGVYSNASVMLSSLFPSINWKFHNLISKHELLIQVEKQYLH